MRVDIKTTLHDSWIVNDRYEIYMDDGTVYDTKHASDIPPYVFSVRSTLMGLVKMNDDLLKHS